MTQPILQRRGTASEWTSTNYLLLEGEIGIELSADPTAPMQVKIGDGVTRWNSLPYFGGTVVTDGGGGSDVVLINNLSTNSTTAALAAAQGPVINAAILAAQNTAAIAASTATTANSTAATANSTAAAASRRRAARPSGLTGTSLTLTAAAHNGMVIESLSASPTTITLNVGANLTAGVTILKTGAGTGRCERLGDAHRRYADADDGRQGARHRGDEHDEHLSRHRAIGSGGDSLCRPDGQVGRQPADDQRAACDALASLQTQITALGARISNLKTINGTSLEGGGNLVIIRRRHASGQVTGLDGWHGDDDNAADLTWSAPSGSPTDYVIQYKLTSELYGLDDILARREHGHEHHGHGPDGRHELQLRVAGRERSGKETSHRLTAGTAAGSGTPTTVMRMSQLFGVVESGNGTSGWHYQHQFASIFNDNCYAISSTAMAGAGVVQWTINPFVGTPDQAGWGLFFSLDNIPGAGGYTSMASNNPSGQNNPAGIQYTGTNWIVTGDSGGGTNPVVITAPAVLRYVRDGSNNVVLSASNNGGTSFSTVWTGTRTGTLYLRIAGEFAVEYGNLLTTGFA
jgi:hypothetical protein